VFEIVELTATQTHAVRRAVLRGGSPSANVVFDGDDHPATFHLGAGDPDDPVAVSTWLERRYPDRPADPAYQLRGMATLPAHQGSGLGSVLLEAGLQICRRRGAVLVWARARDAALGFYERHGFTVVGRGYVDLASGGIPHHDVIHELN
jgi:GNAT superfamily N-acetyltransferase